MAQRQFKKEPLYRKVNTRTHGVRHGRGGDYRHRRNTKAETASVAWTGSMPRTHRHGLDYTPLFRFLVSRSGRLFEGVHSEAVARLDAKSRSFGWSRSSAQIGSLWCRQTRANITVVSMSMMRAS